MFCSPPFHRASSAVVVTRQWLLAADVCGVAVFMINSFVWDSVVLLYLWSHTEGVYEPWKDLLVSMNCYVACHTHAWPRRSVHNLWLCRRDRCTHFLFSDGFLFFFLHNLDSHAWSSFGWCRYWQDASDRITSFLFTPPKKNKIKNKIKWEIKLVGFVPQWLQMNMFSYGCC